MLSVMLSLMMLWTAPRLRDVGFYWSGFVGGAVAFYGFHNQFHGGLFFNFVLHTCYNYFVGLLIFNFFVF